MVSMRVLLTYPRHTEICQASDLNDENRCILLAKKNFR